VAFDSMLQNLTIIEPRTFRQNQHSSRNRVR